ncbi:MAG: hypothetical protein ABIF10_04270 [Candidatus Woesearchaeota archaeon]
MYGPQEDYRPISHELTPTQLDVIRQIRNPQKQEDFYLNMLENRRLLDELRRDD